VPGQLRKPRKRTLSWHAGMMADRRFREQERRRKALEAKIAALRAEFDVESEELDLMVEEERKRQALLAEDRLKMSHLRKEKPSAVGPIALKRRGKGA